MTRGSAAARALPVLVLLLAVPAVAARHRPAPTGCVTPGTGIPAGGNTTDPAAPFFIDTRGLDLLTTPPPRDPANPAYPQATALADRTLPPAGSDGNLVIGPTHEPAPEAVPHPGIPHGTVRTFTMTSADSLIYRPGFVRDDPPGCRNGALDASATAPGDPSDVRVPTSHAGNWTREVDVYRPPGLRFGRPAPVVVFGDGSAIGLFDDARHVDETVEAQTLPAALTWVWRGRHVADTR